MIVPCLAISALTAAIFFGLGYFRGRDAQSQELTERVLRMAGDVAWMRGQVESMVEAGDDLN